jgi:hypothetical protein
MSDDGFRDNHRDLRPPRRNDDLAASRWRGPIFWDWLPDFVWKDGVEAKTIEQPKSVTFLICAFCNRLIWSWPHFEEEIPENAICDACAEEEENLQQSGPTDD